MTKTPPNAAYELAKKVAAHYSVLPQVESVVLAGSQSTKWAGDSSDIDLYVYSAGGVPISERELIACTFSDRPEVGNQFWEQGDEWIDKDSGIHLDVTYRRMSWIEEQIERVLDRHEASVGYSTCFWHNVKTSIVLFDRNGWFASLQEKAVRPFPGDLQRAIIAKNFPLLRTALSSYSSQLKKVIQRGDWPSVNHRIAALFASYFDVVFAVNKLPHPGEKRILEYAEATCNLLPREMRQQVNSVLRAGSIKGDVLREVDILIDELELLLDKLDLLQFVS